MGKSLKEKFIIQTVVPYLQKADDHQDKTVGADPSSKDFIEVSLQEELLQNEDQVRQHCVLLQGRREKKWRDFRQPTHAAEGTGQPKEKQKHRTEIWTGR